MSPLLGKRPDSMEGEREGRQKEGVGKVGRERKGKGRGRREGREERINTGESENFFPGQCLSVMDSSCLVQLRTPNQTFSPLRF